MKFPMPVDSLMSLSGPPALLTIDIQSNPLIDMSSPRRLLWLFEWRSWAFHSASTADDVTNLRARLLLQDPSVDEENTKETTPHRIFTVKRKKSQTFAQIYTKSSSLPSSLDPFGKTFIYRNFVGSENLK